MEQKIRILRLLEYSGTPEKVYSHLANRGLRGCSPPTWNGEAVQIRESFLKDDMSIWTLPAEESLTGSYDLAKRHLKAIEDRVGCRADRYWRVAPTDPKG
jgi:hypothetical protein